MKKPTSRAHAILHVIRARILLSLGDRQLTPRELASDLGDVPLGTLYRHINVLLESGIIEVVGERRVHGTVERTFAIKPGGSLLSNEDRDNLTPEELTGIVQVLTMTINSAFSKFASAAPRPYQDGQFSMLAQPVYLTTQEVEELRATMRNVISKTGRAPGPGLERRVIGFFSVQDPNDKAATVA